MECAIQKGRSRPPRLPETQAEVETQHQLQEQRLSAARLSPLASCYVAVALLIRVTELPVRRLPRRLQ
jgi:hypothetical protein